ncbi:MULTISPECIES: helix-turn-helix transcriptional regulator [unclassified Streptomyces]|uniref:helix-turn-helix domain-containing protein n=1 Tax=unclassified Streptomyces TaxID=2593676 RepID=UPI0033B5F630
MSDHVTNEARVIPLRPSAKPPRTPAADDAQDRAPRPPVLAPHRGAAPPAPTGREPLLRDLVGDVLRSERLAQERTLKDVAEAARISMPYLSEVERGRKEASSEVLAAAARALGLGLGELLSLAQRELIRHTRAESLRSRSASVPSSATRFDGMCLAA